MTRITKSYFLIFILTLLGVWNVQMVLSNDYQITTLSSNDGLSQQDVECILQDQLGFIWIGTYDGLNRYDGNNFILFRHSPENPNTINDNRILALQEWPERNELWIGTDGGGLNCYNQKNEQFTRYIANPGEENCLWDNQVTAFDKYEDELWTGTINGPHCITFDSKNEIQIKHYRLNDRQNADETDQYILALGHDNNGNVIAGTRQHIFIKNVGEDYFREMFQTEGPMKQILRDNEGNLWILSDNAIYYYSLSHQNLPDYLLNPYVINKPSVSGLRKILQISDRQFLLATVSNIYWCNRNDNTFSFEKVSFTQNTFFEDNMLKSLMLDRTMNVWITSFMDGVARFDLNAKSIYNYMLDHPKAKDKNYIQAIAKDRQEQLWIGSSNGLFFQNLKNNTTLRFEEIEESVYGIFYDKDGDIWVNAGNDIYHIPSAQPKLITNLKDLSSLPKDIYPFEGPYAICQDDYDNIWIGMRSGLLRIHKNKGELSFELNDIHLEKTLQPVNNITKLLFDKSKNCLLVGTKNTGLQKIDISSSGEIVKTTSISKIEHGKAEHIWSIYKASDDSIYIGTDSGLKKLVNNETELEPVDCDDIRIQNYKITSIVEDGEKNLWLSTSMGLLRYSLQSKEVMIYLNTDGLSTNTLSEGSLYDSSSNKLYIGSIKGVNIIDLSTLKINHIAPESQFISLKINNEQILPNQAFNKHVLLTEALEYTNEIRLRHNENNFTIEFAALHYSNPNKNRYSYLLKDFSQGWTEVNSNIRSATFTNVPPGKYELQLRSANCDGVWSDNPRVLSIIISPPLWNTMWAYILYALIVGLIMYLVFRYLKDKELYKRELLREHLEHKKEMEIAEVKLKYHTNITHELRTPLSLISAPIEELIGKSYNDDFLNSRLQIVKSNADRLLQLIGQFLDFRKVINEKYSVTIRRVNLLQVLLKVKDDFSSIARQKGVVLEYYNDMATPYCWCDKEVISKICSNLLSNAIKYTPRNGRVTLYASQSSDNQTLYLSVEDTGIGISEKEINKIFERFYQVPGGTGGTGIGLNLCKHLALLHKGDIAVKSRPGEGSIFTLEIPIFRDVYPDEMISDENENPAEQAQQSQIEEEFEKADNKPLILIIEDNFELRDYINALLSETADVIVANNGKEGYEMATGSIPDIIVSDIMMPVMDGIEFTQKCKRDMRTSHIPIILLTAKSGQDNEIEGLTYGADDYITKPFNPKILKLRVHNLLMLTQQKKEEIISGAKKLNEQELHFIGTFEKIVLDNISSPEFGIDDICKKMAMSRMQLYRKMQAIINKKPSQYIKELKMKKAYTLITEKGLNITETMYEVGYANYSHFSRLYAEINGKTPREQLGMKSKQGDKE